MAFLGVWKISEMKIDEAHIIEGVISHLLVSRDIILRHLYHYLVILDSLGQVPKPLFANR